MNCNVAFKFELIIRYLLAEYVAQTNRLLRFAEYLRVVFFGFSPLSLEQLGVCCRNCACSSVSMGFDDLVSCIIYRNNCTELLERRFNWKTYVITSRRTFYIDCNDKQTFLTCVHLKRFNLFSNSSNQNPSV